MENEDLLLRIAGIVLPLFGIIAAGWWYGRHQRPNMALANQLNMEVFVPALVFAVMADKTFDLTANWRLAAGAFLVLLTSGLLAVPVARLLKVQAKTFVPPMMFNNSGNLGLPLAILAFGKDALAPAVVMFLVENLLHFTFGAWWLDHSTRLRMLWRVPVVAASLAGLAFSFAGIHLWPPLLLGIRMLGDVSVPLLLFSLGVRLNDVTFDDWHLGAWGAFLRPISGMVAAVGCVLLFGLEKQAAAQLILFGALPPAVLNYVFAERYQQEPIKVASIVLIGNVAGLLFIPLALAWVLP
jgi:predicted permease